MSQTSNATEGLAKICKLLDCAEFSWFMRECIIKKMDILDAIIHDKNKSSLERESALDAFLSLHEACEWPDKVRTTFGDILGHKQRSESVV